MINNSEKFVWLFSQEDFIRFNKVLNYFSASFTLFYIFLGSICLLAGVIITTIEIIYPHSFSTILEVDYDTPYDRHVIIEDSKGKRYQKKKSVNGSKLEEPASLGSRILR